MLLLRFIIFFISLSAAASSGFSVCFINDEFCFCREAKQVPACFINQANVFCSLSMFLCVVVHVRNIHDGFLDVTRQPKNGVRLCYQSSPFLLFFSLLFFLLVLVRNISDGFFDVTDQPKKVAVVGAGYIAVELAGIFDALGTETHLFIRHERAMRTLDPLLSDILDLEVRAVRLAAVMMAVFLLLLLWWW